MVSQIPALLITISSGILTTRVAPGDGKSNLGASLQLELLSSPKTLAIGGALALTIGLIPGLPTVPFGLIGGGMSFGAYALHKKRRTEEGERSRQEDVRRGDFQAKLEAKVKQAKAQRAVADNLAPTVVPIGVDLDPELSRRLGFDAPGEQDNELLGALVPELRDALYLETGVRFPGVRVRSHLRSVPEGHFVVRIELDPIPAGMHVPSALQPGMRAEILLLTGQRTLLDQLIDPLMRNVHKAFNG